jgi:hypothetical protein
MEPKKFRLLFYSRYFYAWRWWALPLIVISMGLWMWNPPQLREQRTLFELSAGLGLLTLAVSFGLSLLAWTLVNETQLTIQLPFYRVQIPLELINATRITSIERIIPLRELDDDLINLSAVVIDLRRWPQPRPVLQFWLGRRMVLEQGLVLAVKDWFGLQDALDRARAAVREQKRSKTE